MATEHTADQRTVRDQVLAEAKNGNLVILTGEGTMVTNVDEFIKQPADGILYDLNRSPEIVLTFIDDPKWVNDFAVGLVIKKLKDEVDRLAKGQT